MRHDGGLTKARVYRSEHKVERAAYLRKWRRDNGLALQLYAASRRRAALIRLGDKCVRCGFSDWRALQIDHVNGGGSQARVGNPSIAVDDVLAGRNLDQYQCLCANCNWIKRYENQEAQGHKTL